MSDRSGLGGGLKNKIASDDPFEHDPVPLKTFVYGKAYLRQPSLSEVQYEAVRHLEPIYLPSTWEALGWDSVRLVNFAALQWGKGSGKDHICRITLARWVYLLQCLKSPITYYGKAPQDFIHFLNIASSAGQASRVFFSGFRELIKAAPVFKGKYDVVAGAQEPGKYEIAFHKQITVISGHSGSSSQEGLNLLGAIADEISEFKTKAESEKVARTSAREPSNTADGIIKMMRTSGRSRFPSIFKNVYISWPRFADDAIQQLTARGYIDNDRNGEASKWYVSGPLPTWEVNPTVSDREAFQPDYDEDPATAEAMYECKPGRATNRRFRNDVAIAAAFARRAEPPPLQPVYYWGKDENPVEESSAPQESEGWQIRYEFTDLWPFQGALYALHADMAKSGDRAGISMCHVSDWETRDWGGVGGIVREPRPVVKVDFVVALEADTGLEPVAREVQLRWFRKLVWVLMQRGFPVGWASMDGWQSEDSLQILVSRGIEAERLSCDVVTTPVWGTLQDVMYDGRLEGYHDDLLIKEIASLRRLTNGKVDHPDGGSKDLADALAGAVYGALQAGGTGEGRTPVRADVGVKADLSMSQHSMLGLPEDLDSLLPERPSFGSTW